MSKESEQNYMIVLSDTITGLEKKVQKQIDDGWLPIGGLFAHTIIEDVIHYYQAMYIPAAILVSLSGGAEPS